MKLVHNNTKARIYARAFVFTPVLKILFALLFHHQDSS